MRLCTARSLCYNGCMLGLSFFALIELRLWPFFQAGWGTIPDAIHNLLTDGGSTLVGLRLSAPPAPPCSARSHRPRSLSFQLDA